MRWITGVRKEELKQDILMPAQKIEIIKRVVCEEFGQEWSYLSQKGQKGKNSYTMANKSRVFAKQVFMYFTRELTKEYAPRTPVTSIAKMLQGEAKSHLCYTTILYAVRMINNAQQYDKELRMKLNHIRESIEKCLQEERNKIAMHI